MQTVAAMLKMISSCKRVEKRNFWANRMVTLTRFCPSETEKRQARQLTNSEKQWAVGDRLRLWAGI